MNLRLPSSDSEGQKFVSVYAIHAGSIYLPDKEVFEDSLDKHSGSKVPSFAFLIEHSEHGRLMFDLGLRKHGKGYPPAWDEVLEELTVDCPLDVVDFLKDGAITPDMISIVVYSHLHFDHVGDLTPFVAAELVLGDDAAELMQKPYPRDPESLWQEFPAGQRVRYVQFDSDRPPSRLVMPIGSFERGLDFFGDGSFYLIDAPGHLPGHLAALARIADSKFVLLAADCCHNRLCYDPGERLISHENYHDIRVARETVQRLKTMNQAGNVLLIPAHEKERLEEMPLFPSAMNNWAEEQLN